MARSNFLDHERITRRVFEYAYGIDTRDFDLYRSIFDDRVDIDFSSYNGRVPSQMAADDWVAGVQPLFLGLDATQHSMSNPLVDMESDGSSAHCRMYMQAAHFLDGVEFTIGGYYDDRLVRRGRDWCIAGVTLNVWWRRGDDSIMARAHEIGARRLG